jgi:hypothetical protein
MTRSEFRGLSQENQEALMFSLMTGLQGPKNALEVIPNDATDLDDMARGFIVAVAGDLSVVTEGGQTVTFPVLAGQQIVLSVTRVLTATTATVIAVW